MARMERSVILNVKIEEESISEYVSCVDRVRKAEQELRKALSDLSEAVYRMSDNISVTAKKDEKDD